MTIVAAVLAFLGRFVGKLVEMAFGWATVMLFGRVPDSKRLLLSAVALGAVAWVAMVVGVVVPPAGDLMVDSVPAPDFVRREWLEIAMIVLAAGLPPAIGVAGIFLTASDDRPRGGVATAVQVLRGYPYALVLALVLALLLIVAPIRKMRSVVRRWEDAHIPVLVKPGGYERVADDLETALDNAGLEIGRARAPVVLEIPSRLVAAVGGGSVRALVPDRVLVLKSRGVEVTIYPSDVAVAGVRAHVARARAAITSRLTFTSAYQTTSKEAQEVEDRLERIAAGDGMPWRALTAVDERLAILVVSHEDWSVLYRQRLQVELMIRRRQDAPGGNGAFDPIAWVGDLVRRLVG